MSLKYDLEKDDDDVSLGKLIFTSLMRSKNNSFTSWENKKYFGHRQNKSLRFLNISHEK